MKSINEFDALLSNRSTCLNKIAKRKAEKNIRYRIDSVAAAAVLLINDPKSCECK